ncbi:MAG: hypothetical protein QOE55_4067 [Acidobacteriaceae bacterium]|nr:hypothetical protein [Acidobacteriaceae bacterium]
MPSPAPHSRGSHHDCNLDSRHERRNHPTLRNPRLSGRLQHLLQQPHRYILDSSRHFGQQLIMPHVVKSRSALAPRMAQYRASICKPFRCSIARLVFAPTIPNRKQLSKQIPT